MESISRKLMRRARARRHHERHARAAKTRRPKRLDSSTDTSIPKLPQLRGSQCLTTTSEGQPIKSVAEEVAADFGERVVKSDWDEEEKEAYRGHVSDTALTVTAAARRRRPQRGRRLRRMSPISQAVLDEPIPHLVPPSPPLSQLVREKTEGMNLAEGLLTDIKEMNSQLHIVNWLWGERRESGNNPFATSSGNLVLVRRNSYNWFDIPCLTAPREDQLTPLSVNSDLTSDYEEELMEIM